MKIRLAVVLGTAALAAACATPTGRTTAPAGGQTTTTPAAPATTAPAATATAMPGTTQQAAAPKTCTVPHVVGMVHQTAQDTMQAAGLFMLREEDATGLGRMLVMDRNWTTVEQSVQAGQVVDCSTTIVLKAKKTDE